MTARGAHLEDKTGGNWRVPSHTIGEAVNEEVTYLTCRHLGNGCWCRYGMIYGSFHLGHVN